MCGGTMVEGKCTSRRPAICQDLCIRQTRPFEARSEDRWRNHGRAREITHYRATSLRILHFTARARQSMFTSAMHLQYMGGCRGGQTTDGLAEKSESVVIIDRRPRRLCLLSDKKYEASVRKRCRKKYVPP